MKRANSPKETQDGAPNDALVQLANKCSRIASRLAGTEERRPVNLARHQSHCNVCRHPNREAIEHDYLEWRCPSEIAIDYGLSDRTSIYRHAHATGLLLLRRRTYRASLERIMECAEQADVTAAAVVLAVRAYARINDDGQWVEPPHTIRVARADAEPPPPPAASPEQLEGSEAEGASFPLLTGAPSPTRLNRNTPEIEEGQRDENKEPDQS